MSSKLLFGVHKLVPKKNGSNFRISSGAQQLHQHYYQQQHQQQQQQQQQTRGMGHTVRVIALEDLPHGKAYKGDVVKGVKAGYARNFLIPHKLALYATPQNFDRLQILDPDQETDDQRRTRLDREASTSATDDKDLKEADLLKKYLKNKVLQIWRTVDPNSTETLHPGTVTSDNLRQKLSKQLKIDLEETKEPIHIYRSEDTLAAATSTVVGGATSPSTSTSTTTTVPINFSTLDESKIQAMVDDFIPDTTTATQSAGNSNNNCSVRINRLGEYLAVIGLNGGYNVPLRFSVRQRRA